MAAGRGHRGSAPDLLFQLSSLGLGVGIAVAARLLFISGPLSSYLHVSHHRVIYALAAASLIALLVSETRGALQGLQRWTGPSSEDAPRRPSPAAEVRRRAQRRYTGRSGAVAGSPYSYQKEANDLQVAQPSVDWRPYDANYVGNIGLRGETFACSPEDLYIFFQRYAY